MCVSSVDPVKQEFYLGYCCTNEGKGVCMCVNDKVDISGSLESATCVSVNRPAELQKGAKFCSVSDLWPRGAFFLTGRNLIYPEQLCYTHLLRPAHCPTKDDPRMTSSTCTDLHLRSPRANIETPLVVNYHFSAEEPNANKDNAA